MALNRSDLRLALTAGLANGFASLSPLPFGIYMPLAVLAVCSGTFGGSIRLGRQRLLGSLLGMGLLIVGMKGLTGVPFPLAIALCLGLLRLLGGLLGLEVGYKVGGMIIIMGWLVHDDQLSSWVPLRLFWTAAGILVGVLSMRFLWPATALSQTYRNLGSLLKELARELREVAELVEHPEGGTNPPSASASDGHLQAMRQQVVLLRNAMPAIESELGGPGLHHAQSRLLLSLLDTCSTLIMVLDGLQKEAPTAGASGTLVTLQKGEAELVRAVADQLLLWLPRITQSGGNPLGPPPQQAWHAPESWQRMHHLLSDSSIAGDQLSRLKRHATRLMLCGQAERAISRTEGLWRSVSLQRTRTLGFRPAKLPGHP